MWRLFCHCWFLIIPSFGASGKLCFMIVEFSGFLLFFCTVCHGLFALPLGVIGRVSSVIVANPILCYTIFGISFDWPISVFTVFSCQQL